MCEGIFGLPTLVLPLDERSGTRSVTIDRPAVVVTGLERVSAPVAIKLRREVARTGALLVWVRDEDYDGAPPWLVSTPSPPFYPDSADLSWTCSRAPCGARRFHRSTPRPRLSGSTRSYLPTTLRTCAR